MSFLEKHVRNETPMLQQDIKSNTAKIESSVIETIVKLGSGSLDAKTRLKAAMSLAHITEVLNCNECVANDDAIAFMAEMVKDTR